MANLLYAVVSVAAVSVLSLFGILAISLREKTLDRILFILLSFSAGSILATAYLDLLPEAIELFGEGQLATAATYLILGFLGFFFLERFIYWYHGHVHGYDAVVDEKMTMKRFVYLNLLGDGIHNLVDGMIITAAFLVAVPAGVTATLAVIFHELPQEIGDFGVLVYGGFTRHRALLANFLTALTAFAGVLLASYFSAQINNFASYLIAFGGGGFTYIAAAELIPEMQEEKNLGRSAVQFAIFILGLVLIWLLVTFIPG